jgi:type II secretory pathway pseudopilin PulG
MLTPSNQKGFSLIYLIVIMLILAGVGAAIYSFTTSTAYTELTENNRNRAYQLAVAGMNYAAERYAAGIDLNDHHFKGETYTLANNRGQITYSVTLVTGAVIPYYDVVSIGTVNNNNGLLLARAQVRSGNKPGSSSYFPHKPPSNQVVAEITMDNLEAFRHGDLTDAAGHPMVKIEAYVATGGTHMYWAAFVDQGTYPRTDGDNPGCPMGFHTAQMRDSIGEDIREVWQDYNHVDYDLQVKVGWYLGLQAAVSGLNFRWHETTHHSGLFEGYGLAFMRYTYSASGCGTGYDYIPNSIKPTGQANKLLLVLWEQRVEGGVERRRWLAYADLGTPATYPNPRTGNDLKVVGAQDAVDGLVNDNALLMARVRENFIQGQRVNEINVFYGDASPYYDGERTPNSVATDITRKRMFPQWIRSDLFPRWPSNKLGLFSYTDSGISYTINNFWVFDYLTTIDPTYYDFFTLVSASDKIGPDPSSPTPTTPVVNPVRWIINPAFADPEPDPGLNPGNTDLVKLLPDKATLRTYKFVLNTFDDHNNEVGIHGMGNLNSSDRVVAFDDFAIQILGR